MRSFDSLCTRVGNWKGALALTLAMGLVIVACGDGAAVTVTTATTPVATTASTTVASTTVTTTPSVVTTTSTTVPVTTTTAGSTTTTTVVLSVPVGSFCVKDTAWNDALNVRATPGGAIIGTLAFYASDIHNTGRAIPGTGGVWYEIVFNDGSDWVDAWVASWFLTPAPCGPFVVSDMQFLNADTVVDFDPGEVNPVPQVPMCGDGGDCWRNGSTTDRDTLPLDPAVQVFLFDQNLQFLPPLNLGQFKDYLLGTAGTTYDSSVHFYVPDQSAYHLVVTNGIVTKIEQVFWP